MRKANRIQVLSRVMRVLVLVGLILMSACSEDESAAEEDLGGCEVTLDGGPYNNSTFTTDETAMPVYIEEEDMNIISFYGGANGEEVLVRIMYPGRNPGKMSWTEETCYVATTQVIDGEIVQGSQVKDDDPLTLHSGYVEVLRYDEKAGIITGKFEGGYSFFKDCEPEPCIEWGTIEGSFAARMN